MEEVVDLVSPERPDPPSPDDDSVEFVGVVEPSWRRRRGGGGRGGGGGGRGGGVKHLFSLPIFV